MKDVGIDTTGMPPVLRLPPVASGQRTLRATRLRNGAQRPARAPASVAAPAAAPVAAPAAAPVAAPAAAPVAPRLAAPVGSPVAAPVAARVATPAAAPLVSRVAASVVEHRESPATSDIVGPTRDPLWETIVEHLHNRVATDTSRTAVRPSLPWRHRTIWQPWLLLLALGAIGMALGAASGLAEQSAAAFAVEGLCAAATVAVLWRSLRMRRGRSLPRGLFIVSCGVLVLVASAAVGTLSRLHGASDLGLPIEIAGSCASILIIVGLVAPVPGGLRGLELNTLLEAALIAGVVLFSTWVVLVNQGWAITLPMGAGLIRPGLDCMIVMLLLARPVDEARRRYSHSPWRLLTAGAVILLAADTARSIGLLGGPRMPYSVSGVIVVSAIVLLAAGVLHSDTLPILELAGAPPTKLNRIRLGFVMAAVVAGPIALVLGGGQLHGGQIALGTVALSALSVAYLVGRVEEGSRSEHLALHDELTGLPKRLLFGDRVGAAVRHGDRTTDSSAVMFLDLDRFKTINDSLGHAAGNDLLRLVAMRLIQTVRDEDTVARLGGDEFAILLPGLDEAAARAAAERILMAFLLPFTIGGRALFVTSSVGIAIAPDHGRDVDTLLRNADAAMYQAKAAGRNTFRQYTADMNAEAHQRLTIESNLHTAIARGELVIFYQPKVDVNTLALVGMEALVRWRHPERGLLCPDEFIPLAEETGLIVQLGEWVLETACRQTQLWRDQGSDLVVAVNLSARQFQNQKMADVVARALRRTALPAHALELELTETVALVDPVATTATLLQLKSMGVSCSIDDFGTGYSGLSYLTRLPIDRLKIDKGFIDQIANGEDEARIVGAVIALAHELRMTVVAEGVETTEQLRFLQANGCDDVQGYLISRPLSSDDFGEFLVRTGVQRAATPAAPRARVPKLSQLARTTSDLTVPA